MALGPCQRGAFPGWRASSRSRADISASLRAMAAALSVLAGLWRSAVSLVCSRLSSVERMVWASLSRARCSPAETCPPPLSSPTTGAVTRRAGAGGATGAEAGMDAGRTAALAGTAGCRLSGSTVTLAMVSAWQPCCCACRAGISLVMMLPGQRYTTGAPLAAVAMAAAAHHTQKAWHGRPFFMASRGDAEAAPALRAAAPHCFAKCGATTG